jgi:hypothetical protein
LPFYDRRVIASIMRIPSPLRSFLRHAFYHHLVNLLPPIVRSVPWQTYPDHLPCPTVEPAPPPDQWSRTRANGNSLAKVCLRLTLSPGLARVLRRRAMLGAIGLHYMGRHDYDYLFRTCVNIQTLCGGDRPYVICDSQAAHTATAEGPPT